MADLLGNALSHLHPMLVHFPLALLIAGWALDVAARWRPALHESGWVLLLLGTVATIPTVITGVIAHLPYEESSAIGAIETHERLGIATMVVFLALAFWRWRSRRGAMDAAQRPLYLALAFGGVLLLSLASLHGGYLVYQLGVGVKGIAP